jgi:hypothetical protein
MTDNSEQTLTLRSRRQRAYSESLADSLTNSRIEAS